MNKQEIFDTVARHLLTQGERAANRDGYCKYRHGKLKCAVGCLIADEYYTSNIEGHLLGDVALMSGLNRSIGKVSGESMEMLQGLQCIHDLYEPEEWHEELARKARKYKVKPTVLREFQ